MAIVIFAATLAGCSVQPGTRSYCFEQETYCRIENCSDALDLPNYEACIDKCEDQREECISRLPRNQ
jgi:hypothetical protein